MTIDKTKTLLVGACGHLSTKNKTQAYQTQYFDILKTTFFGRLRDFGSLPLSVLLFLLDINGKNELN